MEQWKEIEGYEKYEVSNYGNVRNINKGLILKPMTDKYGYNTVNLYYAPRKYKSKKIHRLVAIAFIKKVNKKNQINHIDCNKENNNVSNLEWCSASENQQHAIRNGLINHAKGEKHGASKLYAYQIPVIFNNDSSHEKIAKEYNVSRKCISKIKNGKTWKHITQLL